ncbi:MAG TPA: hypothetical protein VNG69_01725 [Casimicrobiaceae bacterium]|nr:hypothetical protein [Casimicrobiaceae bacterium]
MLDSVFLAIGLALPWALGVAIVALVYRRTAAVPTTWIVGCGWFVGIFALTLWMRAVSLAGMRMSLATVGVPLVIAIGCAGWLAMRNSGDRFSAVVRNYAGALGGNALEGLQRTLWRILIAWLAIRFALLFAEVWWRPLYPWDAWTQWGTKARVWFELGRIVPFVDVTEWLSRSAPGSYFDAGPHYPATVPLFQVWAALLIGRWDDALVNLPWWVCGVAFAIALYGGLRRLGFTRLVAMIGATLTMSLPILNVHIALAGYADLPMAAYVTLGALAALHAMRQRDVSDAIVAVALFLACITVKNPGRAWLVVLLPAIIAAGFPRHGLKLAGILFAGAALTILVLVRTQVKILGYQLLPDFMMPWNALFDAYFSFGNWNLLWYCAIATAIVGWRVLLSRDVAPLTCAIAGGMMFLFVGFAFTNAFLWVEDQSTVNRATLHLAPLVVVWIMVTLRAWQVARDARTPAAVTAPA